MKFSDNFYELTPDLLWENDAEQIRTLALPRNVEALIKHRIQKIMEEMVIFSIEHPDPGEDKTNKINLNLLQGKYLALKELLDDSQNAHGAINVPNE